VVHLYAAHLDRRCALRSGRGKCLSRSLAVVLCPCPHSSLHTHARTRNPTSLPSSSHAWCSHLLGACTSHIGTRLQAMLLELHKRAPGGCSIHASPETDRPLVCKTITMRVGVIHSATASSEGSTHLTVAIRQYDLLVSQLVGRPLLGGADRCTRPYQQRHQQLCCRPRPWKLRDSDHPYQYGCTYRHEKQSQKEKVNCN
jgi:hypothetical protein